MSLEIESLQDVLLLSLGDTISNSKKINETTKNNLLKLKKSKIVIVGAGGVGSLCSELLVRSGCENIILVDGDIVEKSNLGRQLYNFENIGKLKVECLKNKLFKIQNSQTDLSITAIANFIDEDIIHEIIKEIALEKEDEDIIIIDCCDNLNTRRIINEYALKHNYLWVYSGGEGFESVVAIFDYINPGSIDLFSKFISTSHVQTSNCSTGVLNSTTAISASLIVKELLLHCLRKNIPEKVEIREQSQIARCIKFNLLHNKVFEFYIK